jgi:flagellar hook-associated protein 1
MSSSLFGIGVSGLYAAQLGIATTGHNISNAATPGYTRQETLQATAPGMATGAGFIGRGVQVETVRRIYNEFLVNQVQLARAQAAELETFHAQAYRVDTILSGSDAGLAAALQDFFGAVHALAAHPASTAVRDQLLMNAEVLTARFHMLDQQLTDEAASLNRQIAGSIDVINSYAQQIARVNGAIALAQGAAGGNPPNDLLDQREALIAELNRETRASYVKQSDGSYNVFLSTGHPLVMGEEAYALAPVSSPVDPERVEVAYVAHGVPQPLYNANLVGGRLGGLLAFRRETLDAARNAIGQTAIVLAGAINGQHRLGLDAHGDWGQDFFKVGAPLVYASTLNAGDAVVGASFSGDYAALTASDYRLQYDGASYVVTRLADGAEWSFAGFPQTIDGVRLNLASGTMQAGDSFSVRPVALGARSIEAGLSDTARIAAAAPIVTSAALANSGAGRVSPGAVEGPPPPHPDVLVPVTITFTSGSTFDVTRTDNGTPLATGVAYVAGSPISYNGWTVQITGEPAAGDRFAVARSDGLGDNRNALRLAALQSESTVGGSASFQSSYAQLVSRVGGKTSQLSVTARAHANLENEAVRAQQAVSGVNLDEEAARLLRYQQAYHASGKVIQVAASLFDTLLGMIG